jgi:hypothetical protein
LVFVWSWRLRGRDLFDFSVTYFLHSTVCPVDGDLCSSVLAWCLGEGVSWENGSPRGSSWHKKDSGTHHTKYGWVLKILGGGILWIMTIRGFLIRKDGWCIVGVGGDTESGDSWKRCPMDIGSLGLVEALSASCEP